MVTIELDSWKSPKATANLGSLLGSPLSFPAVLGLIAQPLKQESDISSACVFHTELTCRY